MNPPVLDPTTESPAEKLLYRLFQAELPSEFTVLHQVGIVLRTPSKGDRTAEIDFLVIHPDLGLLAIEVKGGVIGFDRSLDLWTTTNRNGQTIVLKQSPISQLVRTSYILRQKVRELPKTRDLAIEPARGLAFPDSQVDGLEFGSDIDRSQILAGNDLDDIHSAVLRMYGKDVARKPLEKAQRLALISALRPPHQVSQLSLMSEIKSNEIRVKELTEGQFNVLDMLQAHNQAVINGCAGSGKTILALEKARLLAEQGFDVLLTCYNKGLSGWLRRNVDSFDEEIRDRVYTAHYHDLAVNLCAEAGQPIADLANRARRSEFWEAELPELLDDAVPQLERRFDAIVADEGQDFDSGWWISLASLLRDPENGVFYIFRDDQQDIYGRDMILPFDVKPIVLNENLRNTKHIHEFTAGWFDANPKPKTRAPEGRAPEVIPTTDTDLLNTLRSIVHRLTATEGLDPSSIVILSPRGPGSSAVRDGLEIGNYRVSWKESPVSGTIRAATIYSFKGLESDVVILVEPTSLANRHHRRELTYVALTRARHHLIVLGSLGPVA